MPLLLQAQTADVRQAMVLGRSRRKWLQLPLMRVGGEDNAMPPAPQLSMLHCGGEAKKLNTKHASLRTGVEGVERGGGLRTRVERGRDARGCLAVWGGIRKEVVIIMMLLRARSPSWANDRLFIAAETC